MATFGNNFTAPYKIILSLFLFHQENIIIANLIINNIKNKLKTGHSFTYISTL